MKILKLININTYPILSSQTLLVKIDLVLKQVNRLQINYLCLVPKLLISETQDLTAKIYSLQQLIVQSQVLATVNVQFLSTLGLTENNQVKSSSSKYRSRSSYSSSSSSCSNSSSSYSSNSSYDLFNGWGVFTQPYFLNV